MYLKLYCLKYVPLFIATFIILEIGEVFRFRNLQHLRTPFEVTKCDVMNPFYDLGKINKEIHKNKLLISPLKACNVF